MNIHDLYTPFLLFIQQISQAVSGGDPLSKGLVSMGIVSGIMVMARKVPKHIYDFLKSRVIVSIRVESRSDDANTYWLYDHVMKKIADKLKGRSFMVRVGRSCFGDDYLSLETDYGYAWFIYQGRFYWVNRDKSASKTTFHEESLVIYTFGKSIKAFDSFFNDYIQPKVRKFFKWDFGPGWMKVMNMTGNSILFLDAEVKSVLDKKIDFFLNNQSWYIERNIPWKLSITLHGEPGTGKTSIIRYIADRLNYSIGLIDLAEIPKGMFFNVIREASDIKIVTGIEDFDISEAGKAREHVRQDRSFDLDTGMVLSQVPEPGVPKRAIGGADLTDLLNTFQGSIPLNGAVTVLTTNHIDKIDPALLRSGRMDLVLEIGKLKLPQIKEFFEHNYPGNILPIALLEGAEFKAAELHGLFLDHPEDPNRFVLTLINKLKKRESDLEIVKSSLNPSVVNGYASEFEVHDGNF